MGKKFKYAVQISWSELDGAYVVRVPELPGCITHGESIEDAAKNAEEAIELHVEALQDAGAEVPVPLAEQSFSGKLNVRLGPELHRDVAVKASILGESLNDTILEAVHKYLSETETTYIRSGNPVTSGLTVKSGGAVVGKGKKRA